MYVYACPKLLFVFIDGSVHTWDGCSGSQSLRAQRPLVCYRIVGVSFMCKYVYEFKHLLCSCYVSLSMKLLLLDNCSEAFKLNDVFAPLIGTCLKEEKKINLELQRCILSINHYLAWCRTSWMPRKPRRSGQLVPRPFAFSPFARAVTRAATASSSKNKVSNSKCDRMSSSKLLGVVY